MSMIFNPVSTSGIGFKLEHYVQASFLASLLFETPIPFGDGLTVKELNFQAKLVANTDDLVVHFSDSTKYFVQSKKGFETNTNETFEEVIAYLWKDFNKTGFDKHRHKFIITTDTLSKADVENGLLVLEWARFSKDYADYYAKLKANKQKLSKFKYFLAAIEKANGGSASNDLVFDFLKTIYIKTYDYLENGSKDREVLKWYLQPFLKTGQLAENALLSLLSYIQVCNQHGATINKSNIDSKITELFDLSKSATISAELIEFIKKSNNQLQHTIHNDIEGYHVNKSEKLNEVQQKLTENKIVIITGEAGVGKSGLAKDLFKEIYNLEAGYLFFKADQLDRSSLAHTLSDIGIHSDFQTLLAQWIVLPRLFIYIDSFEKLYESENKEAFLELLAKLNEINNVKIVATCRSYAVETLRRKFRILKTDIGTVELLPLTDEELADVASNKPKLKNLISNPKLKRLISLPFYLNIALSVVDSLDDKVELSEHEFKKVLWEFIIEKKGSTKSGTGKKRSATFSSIVLRRAIEKKPFVKPDANVDVDLIVELEKDGLLIKHPKIDAYTPAHDIFEDMVVINYLNERFENKQNGLEFISSIDTNPVFRRGTRLWIQQLILDQPGESKVFLSEIFSLYRDFPIVDEILIGILGSDQAYTLISHNIALFLKDGLRLFYRAFHFLKIAYAEPFHDEHPERKTRCVGHGWTALLKLMDEHFSEAPMQFNVIRKDLLKHWTLQFTQDDSIPAEGEIIARHALQLFKKDKETYGFDSKKWSLEVLFFVADYAKDEIEKLLKDAIEAKKSKSSTTEYRIGFYRDLFQMLLVQTFRCIKIYRLFPEMIIDLAKMEWYKNIEDVGRDDYRMDYLELSFGFKEYPYKYFSASAFQTPFRYLFKYHPVLTLQFLVELSNRSIEFYILSDYAQQSSTKQIAINLNDGTNVFLYGDSNLWGTYRGLGASPYLLQSLLMAFEAYLFEVKETDSLPDDLFETVIKRSNSVLLLSVLVSLAIAYPLVFKEKVLALFKNRELFAWDLSRYAAEFVSSHTTIGNEPYYTQERYSSNALKHRKKSLEHLVSTLQFFYPKEICEIIDAYKSTVDADDHLWQLALVRMDMRNTTPEIKEEENIILFNPNPLPENIQEYLDEGKEEQNNDSIAISIFLWADNVFSGKETADVTYEIWKANYEKLLSLNQTTFNSLLDSGKKMAAIGIKHFSEQLTDEEIKVCTQTILNAAENVLAQLKIGSSHGVSDFTNDSIFGIFPLLFKPSFKKFVDTKTLRNTLTDLVILLPVDIKKHLIKGIKDFLWDIDGSIAIECFQTLLKFSQAPHFWREIQQWRNLTEEKFTENFNAYLQKIKDSSDVKPENISLKNHDSFRVLQALQTVSYSLLNQDYRIYLDSVLTQIQNLGDLNDNDEYEFIQGIQILLGNYFINSSDENSAKTLQRLLSFRKEQFKFVMDTLKWFVWLGHDAQYPDAFWFHQNVIWQYVIAESPTIGFIHVILLEPLKNVNRCYKVSENGTGRRLHEVIITQFASDRNLIEATFKLLAGAGSTYQPFCLTWLMKSLPDKKTYQDSIGIFFDNNYMNMFVEQLYDNHLDHIQRNTDQHNYFIMLLNLLIDRGSTSAFRMRDELI